MTRLDAVRCSLTDATKHLRGHLDWQRCQTDLHRELQQTPPMRSHRSTRQCLRRCDRRDGRLRERNRRAPERLPVTPLQM